MLSRLPCPTLCNPWTVAHQATLSVGFSRQEYWSGLPCPSPGINKGIEPASLMSPALAGRFFTTGGTWEAEGKGKKGEQVLNGVNKMIKG